MPGWLDPSATRVRAKEAAEDEARAALTPEIDALRASHERVREMLAEVKYELAWRRFRRKYSPNQPRVPAGNLDGGRWTSGGGRSVSQDVQQGVVETTTGDISQGIADEIPDDFSATRTLVAQNDRAGRPIDLEQERQLGGHTIEGHVGKSQESLLARVRRDALAVDRDGGYADGLRVGSFPSLEAANKLVNATVARNTDKVDLITGGRSPKEELDARFDSVTGYEAYARTERSQPYIRDTYGVTVVIVPDGRTAKGYRVDTAFPMNFGR